MELCRKPVVTVTTNALFVFDPPEAELRLEAHPLSRRIAATQLETATISPLIMFAYCSIRLTETRMNSPETSAAKGRTRSVQKKCERCDKEIGAPASRIIWRSQVLT